MDFEAPPSDDLNGPGTVTPLEDGGVEVSFEDEEPQAGIGINAAKEPEWFDNLFELIDEFSDLGDEIIESTESDLESRKQWEETYQKGIVLLGLVAPEEKNEPFEGACTATHPLLIENVVKFQSKAISEIFPPGGPVKTQILGDANDLLEAQAKRVRDYMNYQITEEMVEYYDEQERLLFALALAGSAFKKTYYDVLLQRPVSEYIPLEQFVVNFYAPDLRRCRRMTQIIYVSPGKLKEQMAAGIYDEVDLGDPQMPDESPVKSRISDAEGRSIPIGDYDEVYTLYEQHVYLDLGEDPDGIELPYVVTVEKDSRQVLSIRRNWDEKDSLKRRLDWFTHYKFVPGLGFYGYGLIHLLGNLTLTATMAMRSLVDAGQFATLPAGFKAKGLRIANNDPLSPGEWRDIEGTGIDISKAILPAPYKEPSATLFQMMEFAVASGQKFADSTDQVVADSTNYGPVGTTLALLDASTKLFSAIHKRLHASVRNELRILARINRDYPPNVYPYNVAGGQQQISQTDFNDKVDIIPVSDPNIPSNSHRLALVNFEMTLAQQAPHLFNLPELVKNALQIAGAPNIDKILSKPQDAQPADPLTDIQNAVRGLPIRAFPGQDHDAHVAVKSAFLLDPTTGGNPTMAKIQPLIEANVQEHLVMKFSEMVGAVAQQMGGAEKVIGLAAQQVMQYNAARAEGEADVEMAKIDVDKKRIAADLLKTQVNATIKNRDQDIKEAKMAMDATEKSAKIASDLHKHSTNLRQQKNNTDLNALVQLTNNERNAQVQEKQIAANKQKANKNG